MMTTAYVNLWNKRVGAVLWNSEKRIASFEYTPEFTASHWDIAPIHMPIEQTGTIFSFSDLDAKTFKGLPGLLADVLPDKYGNALIDAWLAENGRTPGDMNPVEMLCFIGSRGMGALEFEPVHPKRSDLSTKVEISGLIKIAGDILNNRLHFNTQMAADQQKALMDILKIGTSAGGARAKALIAYNEQTGEVRSGQTDAPKGFSQWLIKFDGVHDSQFGETYGFGRVEMAYHRMAINCGIEMTECRLLKEDNRAHFMTRRFDRVPGEGKIHVQTWCALTHRDFQQVSSYSYEELFQTLRILGLPYSQAEQLFRRMVFNVIARNCDDHTKNFAFTMDKDGLWSLSPAYDVCHAYRPGSIWVSRQSLSVNGKREDITRNDLLNVATQMNIKKADQIISDIQNVISNWNEYAEQQGVNEELKLAIAKTLLTSI
jgi:serine/threonine-protein kinase HipA